VNTNVAALKLFIEKGLEMPARRSIIPGRSPVHGCQRRATSSGKALENSATTALFSVGSAADATNNSLLASKLTAARENSLTLLLANFSGDIPVKAGCFRIVVTRL